MGYRFRFRACLAVAALLLLLVARGGRPHKLPTYTTCGSREYSATVRGHVVDLASCPGNAGGRPHICGMLAITVD